MTRTEFLQLIRAEIERRDGLTPCAERLKTPLSTLTRMLAGQRDGKTSKKLLAAVLNDLDIQAYEDLMTGEILLGEDCELVE